MQPLRWTPEKGADRRFLVDVEGNLEQCQPLRGRQPGLPTKLLYKRGRRTRGSCHGIKCQAAKVVPVPRDAERLAVGVFEDIILFGGLLCCHPTSTSDALKGAPCLSSDEKASLVFCASPCVVQASGHGVLVDVCAEDLMPHGVEDVAPKCCDSMSIHGLHVPLLQHGRQGSYVTCVCPKHQAVFLGWKRCGSGHNVR